MDISFRTKHITHLSSTLDSKLRMKYFLGLLHTVDYRSHWKLLKTVGDSFHLRYLHV